ncbi:MAG: hypothetical protein OXC01_13775 [Immundisolibacterales bacterium]|nr:hypothetical protein [Immundisolibacterales bacterium]
MARRKVFAGVRRVLVSGPHGTLAGPGRAIRAAFALAGADAVRLVLTGDRSHADRILEGLGTDPPPDAILRVAARPGLVVVDATGAGARSLRRLARALPRRRPVDGIGWVTDLEGEDDRGAASAARLAKSLRVRAALHVVVPGDHDLPIFVTVPDAAAPDLRALVRGFVMRLVLEWLYRGGRPTFRSPPPGTDGGMAPALEAAIGTACSKSLRLSSLARGGSGLAVAVASTWDRTVPDERVHCWRWAGAAVLAAGVALGGLGIHSQAKHAEKVERALSVLAPVLPEAASEPGTLAGGSKARRYVQAAQALVRAAGPSVFSPLSGLHPGIGPLSSLARRAVRDAVIRPAQGVIRDRVAHELAPQADPDRWLDRAGDALAGVGASGSDATAGLLAAAYGGSAARWARELDRLPRALRSVEIAASREASHGFVETMEAWARNRYANGVPLGVARRAAGASDWRGRMNALRELDTALETEEALWLARRGADPRLERILSRARGILDEPTLARARAAAGRAQADARTEIEGLRAPGDAPLVELDGSEGPELAAAASGLLRAYESLAEEDLFAGKGETAGAAEWPGSSPRKVLASLERLERRLAETRIGQDFEESLRTEVEAAAFDEAARRIEAGPIGPFAAEERAAARAIERLARTRGAYRAADRFATWTGRLDELRARAALDAVEEDDPLAVEFDGETDRHAVLDRVTGGIERLDALYRSAADLRDFRWREIGRTLRGYRDGDRSSVLTRMAERAREYAGRGAAACRGTIVETGGRPPRAAGYPQRAWAAFARRLDAVCREAAVRAAADADEDLRTYYREHLAWRWPYSDLPSAPAVPRSTLAELLRRATDRELEELPADLAAIVAPWRRNRKGEPVLDLVVEWRTGPERERNAEHLAAYRIEGLEALGDGVAEWRYGDRLEARLRLAKDSPLRFEGGAAEVSVPIEPESWVGYVVAGSPAAELAIDARVIRKGGAADRLRVSATLRLNRERPEYHPLVGPRLRLATTRPIEASAAPAGRLP